MKTLKGEIISNEKVGRDLYKMTVFSPYIAKNCLPGQFVNIRCSKSGVYDPLLRRPFSIYDLEEDFKVFSILYLLKGKGTHYLKSLEPGDVIDFIGPLGNGIRTDENSNKKYLLIGGGIGVAPLYYLAKYLNLKKNNVFLAAGFKDNRFLFFEKTVQTLKISYHFCSEDGTHGARGIITDFISENINDYRDYTIYCCGPSAMFKTLKEIFAGNNIEDKAYALFEEIMACGIGVCKGCVVKTLDKNNNYVYKTVCKDGPLFNLGEVVFE
jgi:dihydroorotate dehydrogenase electron transfer subunit